MTNKTQEQIKEQIKELSELAKPIQKFLLENYPTPSAVLITHDHASVIESQLFVPLEIIENTVAETLEE